jgi:hypothetical protein
MGPGGALGSDALSRERETSVLSGVRKLEERRDAEALLDVDGSPGPRDVPGGPRESPARRRRRRERVDIGQGAGGRREREEKQERDARGRTEGSPHDETDSRF